MLEQLIFRQSTEKLSSSILRYTFPLRNSSKKISDFFNEDKDKILNNPDIKYVSLPIIDKSGNISCSISNDQLLLRSYDFLDNIGSQKVGNEITINQDS